MRNKEYSLSRVELDVIGLFDFSEKHEVVVQCIGGCSFAGTYRCYPGLEAHPNRLRPRRWFVATLNMRIIDGGMVARREKDRGKQ